MRELNKARPIKRKGYQYQRQFRRPTRMQDRTRRRRGVVGYFAAAFASAGLFPRIIQILTNALGRNYSCPGRRNAVRAQKRDMDKTVTVGLSGGQ
jgi:hypothetical protein